MINEVRNTVLAALNKENFGYISPNVFNLYAKQAQIEVFNEHFKYYSEAKVKRNARYKGESYSDDAKRHEEIIDNFSVVEPLTYRGANSIFDVTTPYRHVNAVLLSNGSIVEKIDRKELYNLNMSLLTAPSLLFPVYTVSNDSVTIYPSTVTIYPAVTSADIDYIRFPRDPKWTYVNIVDGEPVFNQGANDYQDFELPLDDFPDLVVKILQYCGLTIREAEVVAMSNSEEQENKS